MTGIRPTISARPQQPWLLADGLSLEAHPIGGADHFLDGRTDKLNDLIDEFLVASSSNA